MYQPSAVRFLGLRVQRQDRIQVVWLGIERLLFRIEFEEDAMAVVSACWKSLS
jgi:hypothetical protein